MMMKLNKRKRVEVEPIVVKVNKRFRKMKK